MESIRDSIKYIKPVYEKSFNGKSLNNKHTRYGDEDDPWGYEKGDDFFNSHNVDNYDTDYRKALYESTEDRITQELINGDVMEFTAYKPAKPETSVGAGDGEDAVGGSTFIVFTAPAFGVKGNKLIKGYGLIYGTSERDPIAIEDKRTGVWFTAKGYEDVTVKYVKGSVASNSFTESTDNTGDYVALKVEGLPEGVSVVHGFARADLEADFEGDNLGEVSLQMTDYEFRPRPTTIGVSWSQLSEITLDASFGVSAQETLVDYAAQTIRVNLDYRAIKLAYGIAKTNKKYIVKFDAGYAENSKEGYIHNAATFTSAVETMGDIMLNDIERFVSSYSNVRTGNSTIKKPEYCSKYWKLLKLFFRTISSENLANTFNIQIYKNEKSGHKCRFRNFKYLN